MSNNLPAKAKFEDIGKRVDYLAQTNVALLERAGYSPQAFARIMVNSMVFNPGIAACSEDSVDKAFLTLANAGLVPDGHEAAIVPYGGQATVVPMIEGQIKLARQATPGLNLKTMAVYREDHWVYEEGMYPKLEHIPSSTASNDPADLIYVYAVARLPRGTTPEYEVMSRATIDRFKAYSRAKKGPWFDFYEEMAKKTVTKRLLKRLPKSAYDPTAHLPFDLQNVDEGHVLIADPETAQAMNSTPARGPTPTTTARPVLPKARASRQREEPPPQEEELPSEGQQAMDPDDAPF